MHWGGIVRLRGEARLWDKGHYPLVDTDSWESSVEGRRL